MPFFANKNSFNFLKQLGRTNGQNFVRKFRKKQHLVAFTSLVQYLSAAADRYLLQSLA
jgi:hypothetical protein